MMSNSHLEGNEAYNLIVEKRKKLWYTLFATFQNVSAHSGDIAITDLPMPLNSAITKSNTSSGNNKNLSVTLHSNEDLSADDDNNEELDDVSEAGTEDIAKFSDSDDEDDDDNDDGQLRVKRVVYATDTDGELSEADEDSNDSFDDYWSEVRNSRIHDTDVNEDNDDASECSNDNDNMPQNNDVHQSKKKRKYSETELGNDSLEEKPQVKKFNHVLKKVNLYINANESDFETDSEYLEL